MGLLDDAIREHLELKRRTGAASGDLAHLEPEVLDPPYGDEGYAAWEGDLEDRADDPLEAHQLADPAEADPADVTPAQLDLPVEPDTPARGADFSTVGQETAEIDMRTVLDEDFDVPEAPPPV